MRRAALLIFLAAGFGACGGEPPPGPAPAAPAPAAPSPSGPFRLLVPPRGAPGRPPPVRLAGGAEGVRVAIEQVLDPVATRVGAATAAREVVAEAVVRDRRLDLPALPGGEYRVTASRDGRQETAALVLADLSVVVRGGGDEVLVFAADTATGAPAAGAQVEVGTADERAGGVADARGVFRTRLTLDGPVCAAVRRGASFGLVERAGFPARAGSRSAWVVLGAPEHAPGDPVAFAGFCRPAAPAAGGTFAAEDAEGRPAGEGRLEVPGPGLFAGSFRAAPWAAPGEGRLHLRFPPDRYVEVPLPLRYAGDSGLSVRVALPATASDPPRVLVDHESPGWLAGGTLSWRIEREDSRRPGGRNVLASGERRLEGPISVHLPAADPPFTVVAEVVDAGGNRVREEVSAAATATDFAVRVASGLNFCAPGERPVIAVRPVFTGRPATEVLGTVDSGADRQEFRLSADDPPFAAPLRLPTMPGPCRIVVTAREAEGRTATAGTEVFVLPASDLETIVEEARLIPEKDEYAPGEPARVLLLLPPAVAGASALLCAEGDVLAPHAVEEAAPVMLLTVALPEALGRRVALSVTAAKDGREHGAWAEVRVAPRAGGLRVRLSADTGAEGVTEVRAEVRGEDGEPAEAAVLLLGSTAGEPPLPPLLVAPDGSLGVAAHRGPPAVPLGAWTTAPYWSLPPPERPGRLDLLAVAITPDFRLGTGAAVLFRPPRPPGPATPPAPAAGAGDLVPAVDLVLAPGRSSLHVAAAGPPPPGAALSLRFRLDPGTDPLAAVRDALAGLPPPRTLAETAAVLGASLATGELRQDLVEILTCHQRPGGGFGGARDTADILVVLEAARKAGLAVDAAALARGRAALGALLADPAQQIDATPAAALARALGAARAAGLGPEGDDLRGRLLLTRPSDFEGAALAAVALAGEIPPPGAALRECLAILLPDPFAPPGRNLLERAWAVPALLAAAAALEPPPPDTFTVRVRTSAGVVGSVRLVPGSAKTASATIDLPASRFTPGPEAVILECAGSARALLRVLATPGLLPPPPGAARVDAEWRRVPPPGGDPAAAAVVRPGDLVLVTLRASRPAGRRGPARLSCLLPAGLALLPADSFPDVARPRLAPGVRPERRGDLLSFDLPDLPAEGAEVAILLRAATPGEQVLGPAVLRPGYGGEPEGAAPATVLRVE